MHVIRLVDTHRGMLLYTVHGTCVGLVRLGHHQVGAVAVHHVVDGGGLPHRGDVQVRVYPYAEQSNVREDGNNTL